MTKIVGTRVDLRLTKIQKMKQEKEKEREGGFFGRFVDWLIFSCNSRHFSKRFMR